MVIEHNTEHNERQRWISGNLPSEVKKTPRPYQLEVFQALTEQLNKHKRALAHLATGAGKTYTMQGPSLETDLKDVSRGLIPRIFENIFTQTSNS